GLVWLAGDLEQRLEDRALVEQGRSEPERRALRILLAYVDAVDDDRGRIEGGAAGAGRVGGCRGRGGDPACFRLARLMRLSIAIGGRINAAQVGRIGRGRVHGDVRVPRRPLE